MSGFTTTGASVVTDYSEISRSLGDVASVHAVARRHGDHRPRDRRAAAAARRRPSAAWSPSCPGPEIAQLSERIRDTARMLWVALHRADRYSLTLVLASLGWLGRRRRDDAVRGARARVLDDADRGVLDQGRTRSRGSPPASQWVIAFFMLVAGANFVLLLPRRSCAAARGRLVRDEELRLYLALRPRRVDRARRPALGLRASSRAKRRSGPASSRRSRSSPRPATRATDFALWPVICILTLFALMFVGGSAGSTGRLDQGRPAPAPRQGASPRARPDGEPRGRHADPAERRAGRRAHAARDRRLHPPLRRGVGRRARRSSRSTPRSATCRLGTLDALAVSATRARERRPWVRDRRARWARSRRSATSPRSR